MDIKKYYFDDPYLFKYRPDQLLRRCVSNDDQIEVLTFCHYEACGGHFSARKTKDKILQAGFYWPTLFKDCFDFLQNLCSVPTIRRGNKKEHDASYSYFNY